jgi:hypothetical protein
MRPRVHELDDGAICDDVVTEIGAILLSVFRGQDQRQKAEQYLRGLLFAKGRKSIRNIAAHAGGPAAEQSLHHFISSSTWDWRPLRAGLAAYLERNAPHGRGGELAARPGGRRALGGHGPAVRPRWATCSAVRRRSVCGSPRR